MKRRIGRFYVVVVQWTSKKCTKKRDALAEQLALLIKPTVFWRWCCCCRRRCLRFLLLNCRQQLKIYRCELDWFLSVESPKIRIWILFIDIHTSPLRIIWKNLIEERSLFPLLIIFLVLITFSLDYILISLGENWCWSLLGLKGVILVCNMRLFNTSLSSVAILLYSTVFCDAFLLVLSSCTW